MDEDMKTVEFTNGVFHLVTSASYTLLCIQQQAGDAHALTAFGTAGIGVCLILGFIKNRQRRR